MNFFQDISKLIKNFSLIQRMARKEMTDRYAGSVFGLLWTIIQPLFLITLYTLVFTFVFKVRIGGSGSPISYAFYAIAGLLPWMAFADGLSKSISSISGKTSLVKQAIFPTDILPIVSVLTGFYSLIIGFVIYLSAELLINPEQFSLWLLILPLVILIHFLFMAGLAYFLAIIGVYFRDITEFISLLLTVGLFVTPILYVEQSIPQVFRLPMQLNLIAHLINMYRDVVFYGQINHPVSFIVFSASAILIFFIGFVSFKKVKHLFANVL
jgi:lipopolysaccharide transport system permease protein